MQILRSTSKNNKPTKITDNHGTQQTIGNLGCKLAEKSRLSIKYSTNAFYKRNKENASEHNISETGS